MVSCEFSYMIGMMAAWIRLGRVDGESCTMIDEYVRNMPEDVKQTIYKDIDDIIYKPERK